MKTKIKKVHRLLLNSLLLALFAGCASPVLNEVTISGSARDTAVGICGTVTMDVAREVQRHPDTLPYFTRCAAAIGALARTRTNYISAKPLWAVVNSIPAPTPDARKAVVTGAKFYKGGIESRLDAEYVLCTLAQSIRTGTTEPLASVKANHRRARMQYALLRATGNSQDSPYFRSINFAGAPSVVNAELVSNQRAP
jgi:hypothetical protein